MKDLDFKVCKRSDVAANIFLLTHKCGNGYINNVFRRSGIKLTHFQSDELRGQMPGPYIGDVKEIRGKFANVRCRNFSAVSIEKLLKLVDIETARFFLFVRHPASLFRSAVTYHMRDNELWAREERYS